MSLTPEQRVAQVDHQLRVAFLMGSVFGGWLFGMCLFVAKLLGAV